MSGLCDSSAVDFCAACWPRGRSRPSSCSTPACPGSPPSIQPFNAVVTLDELGRALRRRRPRPPSCAPEDRGALHGLPVLIKDTQGTPPGCAALMAAPAMLRDNVPAADQGFVGTAAPPAPSSSASTNTRNGRRAAHPQPRFRRDRQLLRSHEVGGRLLRRLGGGARPAAWPRSPRARTPAGPYAIRPAMPASSACVLLLASWRSESAPSAASNLSTDGPMARNVADTALMLSVMASDDARDPLAYTLPGRAVARRAERWALPHPAELGASCASPSPRISASHRPSNSSAACSAIASTEARDRSYAGTPRGDADSHRGRRRLRGAAGPPSSWRMHGKNYKERPEMLGPQCARMSRKAFRAASLEDHARRRDDARTRIYRAFQTFFGQSDVLISPTITLSPRPWSELYRPRSTARRQKPYFHWLALAYAVALAGHPAISLACPSASTKPACPPASRSWGPRRGRRHRGLGLPRASRPRLRANRSDCAGRCLTWRGIVAAPPLSAAPSFLTWRPDAKPDDAPNRPKTSSVNNSHLSFSPLPLPHSHQTETSRLSVHHPVPS